MAKKLSREVEWILSHRKVKLNMKRILGKKIQLLIQEFHNVKTHQLEITDNWIPAYLWSQSKNAE